MRKLSHKTAVSTVRDIVTEGEANSESGDVRVANEARRQVLTGTILLQLLSTIGEADFNAAKLANYNKSEMADAATEDDLVNEDN